MRYDLMAVPGVLVLMWAICLGCGLALERVLRVRLANALLLPLGLCVALVLIFPGYVAHLGDGLAFVLLGVVTLAGLAFAQGGLLARLNPGWAGGAGLAAYVLYMLPVIATGHWTWSGYDFVGDSSFEMLLANHMKGFGTTLGSIPETSEREFLNSYFSTGYPLGSQALLGTLSGISDTPVAVLFQGVIAGFAATATVALATVTEKILSPRRAALVALVGISANLTYQYALQGGIKEIALLATLCAAIALGRAAIELGYPYRGATLVAVGAAASLAVYNAVAAPFVGALVLFIALAVLLVLRRRPRVRWLRPLVFGGVLAGLLAIPSLSTFSTFFEVARTGQSASGAGGTVQFGQLLRPLPLSQISGVWLSGDYRLPVVSHVGGIVTVIATVAILLVLLPGLAWALWRREFGPLLLVGMMGLVLLIVYPRVSPYAQGKLLAIASPAVVLVALVGLAAVRGRAAPLALLIAAGITAAVWGSDVYAYTHDRVAPTGRMEAIEATGKHFSGQGPLLWNEFEEYAKYFARNARVTVPFEALTPRQVQLRNPTFFFGHYFDLDEELLSFVEGYPIIVTRRSPAASRPPANYRLVYQNRYYLGWRKSSSPTVLRHLPEQLLNSPTAKVTCAALRPIVAGAPAGSRLMIAEAPELTWFEPLSSSDRSYGWGQTASRAGAVATSTAGHAGSFLKVAGDARYAVWVQGDFPRPIEIRVDGREVGHVSGSNTPGGWLKAATVELSPGGHRVEAIKAGGHRHFAPGDWATGTIGAVALQREGEPERLRTVPTKQWRSLCGREADWVELVRP